jgi:hypothetical protein
MVRLTLQLVLQHTEDAAKGRITPYEWDCHQMGTFIFPVLVSALQDFTNKTLQ